MNFQQLLLFGRMSGKAAAERHRQRMTLLVESEILFRLIENCAAAGRRARSGECPICCVDIRNGAHAATCDLAAILKKFQAL